LVFRDLFVTSGLVVPFEVGVEALYDGEDAAIARKVLRHAELSQLADCDSRNTNLLKTKSNKLRDTVREPVPFVGSQDIQLLLSGLDGFFQNRRVAPCLADESNGENANKMMRAYRPLEASP